MIEAAHELDAGRDPLLATGGEQAAEHRIAQEPCHEAGAAHGADEVAVHLTAALAGLTPVGGEVSGTDGPIDVEFGTEGPGRRAAHPAEETTHEIDEGGGREALAAGAEARAQTSRRFRDQPPQ